MAYNRTRGLAAETSLYPQAEQNRVARLKKAQQMVKCMLYGSPWGQKYNLLTRRLSPLQHTNQIKQIRVPKNHTQKRKTLAHHLQAINSVITILSQAAE